MNDTIKFRLKGIRQIKAIDILICLYMIISLSGSNSELYLYSLITMLGGCFLLIIFNKDFRILFDKRLICVGFFIIYSSIMAFSVAPAIYILKKAGATLIEFFPMFIYIYYSKAILYRKKLIVEILLLIYVCYMCFASYSYTFFEINARRIADHTVDYGEIAIGGGYFLAFASSLLGVFLFDCINNDRSISKNRKVYLYIIILLSTLVIYKTLSTVTLVAFFIGIFLNIVFPSIGKDMYNNMKTLKVVIMGFLCGIMTLLLMPLIGEFIIQVGIIDESVLGNRIQSLGYLLSGSVDGFYALGRLSIPINSLVTFFENPLIGICYEHGNHYYKASYYGAGNHCEWIDALTNYGLICGIPYLYIYYYTMYRIYKRIQRPIGVGLLIMFTIMGLFNPFKSIQSNTALLLFIPLYIDVYYSSKD